MKQLFQTAQFSSLILILVLNIQSISAQNYLAEYSCNSYEWAGKLHFNSKEWLYDVSFKPVVEIKISGDIMDKEIIKDDSDEKIVNKFYYRSLIKNESIDFESMELISNLPIKDVLKQPDWMINFDTTQIIGDYACHLAKGIVKGRNYSVWFAPEIPVTCGPWKLWGLPGLIINAESEDGLYKWSLISLKPSEIQPKKPQKSKTVSPENYKRGMKDAFLKFSRQIRSISENDVEITLNSITIANPDKELFDQETFNY